MKLNYPKKWFERSADIEAGQTIGAGCPAAICSEGCDGLSVTIMRHGDPVVCYRQCVHGRERKQRHSRMKDSEIRSEVLALVKANHSPNDQCPSTP